MGVAWNRAMYLAIQFGAAKDKKEIDSANFFIKNAIWLI
jgi:hypothetical protein